MKAGVTLLFGGTFDPPHIGHFKAVEGLFAPTQASRVIVLPSATPPLKTSFVSAEDRFEMTRLCFESLRPRVEVSRYELDLATQTGAPSYTIHTVEYFRSQYASLGWVLGTDQLLQWKSWHRLPELLKLCDWIVLKRRSFSLEEAQEKLRDLVQVGLLSHESDHLFRVSGSSQTLKIIETPAPSLSSSAIRSEIARHGSPPQESLVPSVKEHLMARGLYGSKKQGFYA